MIKKQMSPFIPTQSYAPFPEVTLLTVYCIYFQPLLYAFMKKYAHISVYGFIFGMCVYKSDRGVCIAL